MQRRVRHQLFRVLLYVREESDRNVFGRLGREVIHVAFLALVLVSCTPVHGAPPFVCEHKQPPVQELVDIGATLVDPGVGE